MDGGFYANQNFTRPLDERSKTSRPTTIQNAGFNGRANLHRGGAFTAGKNLFADVTSCFFGDGYRQTGIDICARGNPDTDLDANSAPSNSNSYFDANVNVDSSNADTDINPNSTPANANSHFNANVDLAAGNARFVAGKPNARNLPADRAKLAKTQSPHVAVLACADSRVGPELLFDKTLGDLFVECIAAPGFAAHWDKNFNLGVAFDQWFLNLFPRTSSFVVNRGGYLTLSFIPTLGTMILGLVVARWLRTSSPRIPMKRLVLAGCTGVAAGLLLHIGGLCPLVKRIWTPGWTLFSGGLCFLFLAAFSWILDVKGRRRWAFPLIVIGMNSIAAYLIAHLFRQFIADSFRIHLGVNAFRVFGPGLEPLMQGAAILAVYWLILFWMYRRKLFLRI